MIWRKLSRGPAVIGPKAGRRIVERIQLSLKVERLRVEASWRSDAGEFVPLAVAAALAFHEAQSDTNASVDADDYNRALDIAASALSRLLPLFTVRDPREGPVAITVDLTRERFARGAMALRSVDGTAIAELSVRRVDLEGALALVKRAGLTFGLSGISD